jgi:hypothetical protein
LHRVACVDNESRILGDPFVIVIRVICDDEDAVLRPEKLLRQRLTFSPNRVMTHRRQLGNERIVVRDMSSAL